MRNVRPILVAVPAFALGCLVTAGLTATAQAQPKAAGSLPKYRIVNDEARMNQYAAQGYEVKSASHTSTFVEYLMQRYR